MGRNGYTPTQLVILNALSDGKPHLRNDLQELLPDDMAVDSALRYHVYRIRKSLRPKGEDIVCTVYNRRYYYQHIRLLASAYDGKR